ncbi:hypothetical protein [Alkaliphilus peptidifermentans]|uniref:Sporulation membrane protein YtrI C-terminal domain-containing protein n=1 Tax=Alkaliphilus peptidifermentans DSM 18978 TaxID=1120976 RepID=A0A1G5AMQ6_9FIRM|nr:hypothetical protein [Alkaliphilus peptidifermentans]SCX79163.1 hypothetical protein SAMN03080606_00211 [Alkaliphilus peptidifermentans DSM 18978]
MKRPYSLIAFMGLGFLLGLATMNLFQMHTLDRLYRVQHQLTNQIIDKDIKLERLNDSIKKNNTVFVKDIKIHLNFEGNLLLKDMIEDNIRFFLSDLVGKELADIDGEMIYKILNNRIVEIENKNINLSINYLIISETINISVNARVIDS